MPIEKDSVTIGDGSTKCTIILKLVPRGLWPDGSGACTGECSASFVNFALRYVATKFVEAPLKINLFCVGGLTFNKGKNNKDQFALMDDKTISVVWAHNKSSAVLLMILPNSNPHGEPSFIYVGSEKQEQRSLSPISEVFGAVTAFKDKIDLTSAPTLSKLAEGPTVRVNECMQHRAS